MTFTFRWNGICWKSFPTTGAAPWPALWPAPDPRPDPYSSAVSPKSSAPTPAAPKRNTGTEETISRRDTETSDSRKRKMGDHYDGCVLFLPLNFFSDHLLFHLFIISSPWIPIECLFSPIVSRNIHLIGNRGSRPGRIIQTIVHDHHCYQRCPAWAVLLVLTKEETMPGILDIKKPLPLQTRICTRTVMTAIVVTFHDDSPLSLFIWSFFTLFPWFVLIYFCFPHFRSFILRLRFFSVPFRFVLLVRLILPSFISERNYSSFRQFSERFLEKSILYMQNHQPRVTDVHVQKTENKLLEDHFWIEETIFELKKNKISARVLKIATSRKQTDQTRSTSAYLWA